MYRRSSKCVLLALIPVESAPITFSLCHFKPSKWVWKRRAKKINAVVFKILEARKVFQTSQDSYKFLEHWDSYNVSA